MVSASRCARRPLVDCRLAAAVRRMGQPSWRRLRGLRGARWLCGRAHMEEAALAAHPGCAGGDGCADRRESVRNAVLPVPDPRVDGTAAHHHRVESALDDRCGSVPRRDVLGDARRLRLHGPKAWLAADGRRADRAGARARFDARDEASAVLRAGVAGVRVVAARAHMAGAPGERCCDGTASHGRLGVPRADPLHTMGRREERAVAPELEPLSGGRRRVHARTTLRRQPDDALQRGALHHVETLAGGEGGLGQPLRDGVRNALGGASLRDVPRAARRDLARRRERLSDRCDSRRRGRAPGRGARETG